MYNKKDFCDSIEIIYKNFLLWIFFDSLSRDINFIENVKYHKVWFNLKDGPFPLYMPFIFEEFKKVSWNKNNSIMLYMTFINTIKSFSWLLYENLKQESFKNFIKNEIGDVNCFNDLIMFLRHSLHHVYDYKYKIVLDLRQLKSKISQTKNSENSILQFSIDNYNWGVYNIKFEIDLDDIKWKQILAVLDIENCFMFFTFIYNLVESYQYNND